MGSDSSETGSLRERVADLEAELEQLRGGGLTRRQALYGLGAAGAGAVLGAGGASQPVQAQEAVGQVGRADHRPDVYGATIDGVEFMENGEPLERLRDGENFDGQGASEFSGLQSVSTEVAEITVHVPSDFDTINEAMNHFGRLLPRSSDSRVTIMAESGHAIIEPIECGANVFCNRSIQSEDATLPVSNDFPAGERVIHVYGGALGPHLNTLIDAQGNGGPGVYVQQCSTFNSGSTNGVINAGGNALEITNNSTARAWRTEWTGAGGDAVRIAKGSRLDLGSSSSAGGSDLSGASNMGIRVTDGPVMIRGTQLTINDTGEDAMNLYRGSVGNFENLETNRNAKVYRSSAANFHGSTFDGAGIEAFSGSSVNARSVDVSGASTGLRARMGSRINGYGASISNISWHNVFAEDGSIIHAHNVTVDGSALTAGDTNLSSLNNVESDGLIFA